MSSRSLHFLNWPLVATTLAWGFNFVALKVVYQEVEAPSLTLTRFLATYVMMLLVCVVRGESLRYPEAWGDRLRLLWLGFLSMGLYIICFMEGMRGTSAAEGAVILAASPIFGIFLAAALKQERLQWGTLTGALVAMLGVAITIFGGHHNAKGSLYFNLLVLLSAGLWACSAATMRPLVLRYSPVRTLALSMPGALVLLIPYGFYSMTHTDWAQVSPVSWICFAHITMLSGVVAFIGFYEGVKQIGVPRAMLYQYFVPVCATLFQWLMFRTALHGLQWVGFFVVLGGVMLANRLRLPVN